MKTLDDKSGIVLQCDASGYITHVIRDDLGITAGPHAPPTLFGIVDLQSRQKAHDFLQAAIDADAAFGWELNVPYNGQPTGLLFIAGVTDHGITVCGSPSRAGLTKLLDEMMKVENEQLNALRMTVKDARLGEAKHRQAEQVMLEDFARLNNELVNTQRKLAQRNGQLADANDLLELLATTDGLTGLKNHRAFQETLESEWARATRYETPLSLFMLDIDRFKQFNDQFGHPAGDLVLKQVATILTNQSRADSFVARYGGEEFAVVLPNCASNDAARIAERVRHAIETAPWDLRPITASLGTATLSAGMPNLAALIAQADAAMYRAKVSGRNRVCRDNDVAEATLAFTN